jgi:hypothetical protein
MLAGRAALSLLIRHCLQRDSVAARERTLPIVVLHAARGSGKSTLLDQLAAEFALVPLARFDFNVRPGWQPRDVLSALVFELSRRRDHFGVLQFPRFLLGALVIDASANPSDRDAARRRVRELVRRDWRRRMATVKAAVTELGNTLEQTGRMPAGGKEALPLVMEGLGALGGLMRGAGYRWYASAVDPQTQDPEEVLVDLSAWSVGSPEQRDRVEAVLCAAFLADLRDSFRLDLWAVTRDHFRMYDRNTNYIAVMDNVDSAAARAFLDTVVRERQRHAQRRPDDPDPLIIVAASRHSAPDALHRDPIPYELSEDVSYGSWEARRGQLRSVDSWFYRIGPDRMSLDEVARQAEEQGLGDVSGMAAFTHRLTDGHAWAVRLLFEAFSEHLDGPAVEFHPAEALRIGAPRARTGRATPRMTVGERARQDLLYRDIDPDLRAHLPAVAATRDVAHLIAQPALHPGDSDVAGRIRDWLVDRLWVQYDESERAARRGVVVLRPLVRRLLLDELMARRADAPDGWVTVHEGLRDGYRDAGQESAAIYHDLALDRLGPVVDHFCRQLGQVPGRSWYEELCWVAAAPRRLGSEGGRALVRELLGRLSAPAASLEEAVAGLIVSKWVAFDPLSDPFDTLAPVIANWLTTVHQRARDRLGFGHDLDFFYDEAESYRRGRRAWE